MVDLSSSLTETVFLTAPVVLGQSSREELLRSSPSLEEEFGAKVITAQASGESENVVMCCDLQEAVLWSGCFNNLLKKDLVA